MMEGNFWRLIKKFSDTSFAGVPYNYEMILRLGVDKLEISSINKMTQAGGRLDFNKIEKINNFLKSKNIKLQFFRSLILYHVLLVLLCK